MLECYLALMIYMNEEIKFGFDNNIVFFLNYYTERESTMNSTWLSS